MTTDPEAARPPLADPTPCLRAGHDIVAWWPTDTAGFLQWNDAADTVYVWDTKLLDPGPTDAAECRTCEIPLDPAAIEEML
jgi:hypothetical protein